MISITSQNASLDASTCAPSVERLPSPFTFAMDRLRRLLGLFGGGLRQENVCSRSSSGDDGDSASAHIFIFILHLLCVRLFPIAFEV
jgi:hypothetical protein